MERQEFCAILNERRNELEMSWLDMTVATKTNGSTLQKILSGETNFFVESAWKVMEALKLTLIVEKTGKRYQIMNQAELNAWAEMSKIFARMSVVKFAEQCKMSRMALTDNLKGKSKMRIDTFLRWADVTGYQVEISK